MVTKQDLIVKWIAYALGLLLFCLVQQLILDPLSLWGGVHPFLLPILVAVLAALEGPTEGVLAALVFGIVCDLTGGGVFFGIYTLAFCLIALVTALIAGGWVMRNLLGCVVYALLSLAVMDAIQMLYFLTLHGAHLSVLLSLAGRETALSVVFVIPIYLLFSGIHKRLGYEA